MALIKDSFCQYKQQWQWRQQHKHHIEMNGPNDLHFIHSMLLTCEPFSPISRICLFSQACGKTYGLRYRTTQMH